MAALVEALAAEALGEALAAAALVEALGEALAAEALVEALVEALWKACGSPVAGALPPPDEAPAGALLRPWLKPC